MKRTISVYISPDHYNITMQGPFVLRIVKFMGDTQQQSEVLFSDLTSHVQNELMNAVLDVHREEETNE